tara:strand:- start:160 stop:2676 length:2517 start_codon:yes stop_codon:yes gene_type:complete
MIISALSTPNGSGLKELTTKLQAYKQEYLQAGRTFTPDIVRARIQVDDMFKDLEEPEGGYKTLIDKYFGMGAGEIGDYQVENQTWFHKALGRNAKDYIRQELDAEKGYQGISTYDLARLDQTPDYDIGDDPQGYLTYTPSNLFTSAKFTKAQTGMTQALTAIGKTAEYIRYEKYLADPTVDPIVIQELAKLTEAGLLKTDSKYIENSQKIKQDSRDRSNAILQSFHRSAMTPTMTSLIDEFGINEVFRIPKIDDYLNGLGGDGYADYLKGLAAGESTGVDNVKTKAKVATVTGSSDDKLPFIPLDQRPQLRPNMSGIPAKGDFDGSISQIKVEKFNLTPFAYLYDGNDQLNDGISISKNNNTYTITGVIPQNRFNAKNKIIARAGNKVTYTFETNDDGTEILSLKIDDINVPTADINKFLQEMPLNIQGKVSDVETIDDKEDPNTGGAKGYKGSADPSKNPYLRKSSLEDNIIPSFFKKYMGMSATAATKENINDELTTVAQIDESLLPTDDAPISSTRTIDDDLRRDMARKPAEEANLNLAKLIAAVKAGNLEEANILAQQIEESRDETTDVTPAPRGFKPTSIIDNPFMTDAQKERLLKQQEPARSDTQIEQEEVSRILKAQELAIEEAIKEKRLDLRKAEDLEVVKRGLAGKVLRPAEIMKYDLYTDMSMLLEEPIDETLDFTTQPVISDDVVSSVISGQGAVDVETSVPTFEEKNIALMSKPSIEVSEEDEIVRPVAPKALGAKPNIDVLPTGTDEDPQISMVVDKVIEAVPKKSTLGRVAPNKLKVTNSQLRNAIVKALGGNNKLPKDRKEQKTLIDKIATAYISKRKEEATQ